MISYTSCETILSSDSSYFHQSLFLSILLFSESRQQSTNLAVLLSVSPSFSLSPSDNLSSVLLFDHFESLLMSLHISTILPIYLTITPPFYESVTPSVHHSTNLYPHQFTILPFYLSISSPFYKSISPSVHHSTNLSPH